MMDSSFFLLRICATATGFFTLFGTLLFMVYKSFRSKPQKEAKASYSFSLSAQSSLSSSWKHDVFISFYGSDIHRSFLTHILKEFRIKGIDPFTNSEITHIEAIRRSKISIVILSRNYALSFSCVNELVEIMKCKEELGQVVVPIFYELEPVDVLMQTRDFGKFFKAKTKEDTQRWRQALAQVARLAGVHSRNWSTEAAMIECIVTDISERLNNGLVGTEAHMENTEPVETHMVEETNPQNQTMASSSLPSSPLTSRWKHDVFPSFRGEDIRVSLISHILKEFISKGIDPFIDNEIKRGKSIGPELKEAIRSSRISIVMLSRNYASSSWCLNELVEIMKCREELGQIVMVLFYEVDPSDVKKQTGDFGKAFRKTCKSKTDEVIKRWKQALTKVATIAGYHSRNWETEGDMIEQIANDMSNKLNNFTPSSNSEGLVEMEDHKENLEPDEADMAEETAGNEIITLNNSAPSSDFDSLVGMEAHIEKVERMLCLDSDEVKMVGISGPRGIGKTTIANCVYQKFSHQFQLSTIVSNIKECYTNDHHEEHTAKSQLLIQLFSQLSNQKDTSEILHLGVAQEMLKDKKVFVILDGVDKLGQLDALEQEIRCFGPGSRIIIITRSQEFLKAYEINHIYKVDYPLPDEALQIFCIYAFRQKYPYDGFMELAKEVATLSGNLPKGLWFVGSYLYGMSEQEWINELPRLRNILDGELASIERFGYESARGEKKKSTHHIVTSVFNGHCNETVEEYLAKSFLDMREEPIITNQDQMEDLHRSERALEALRSSGILRWKNFPIQCWPPTLQPENLVELYMPHSKFEKLWDGIIHLGKLTLMDLSSSKKLKELPDLSNAFNLKKLDLKCCSSLVELPDSIGGAITLLILNLEYCSRLVDLPSSIGNAFNLRILHLRGCSNLVELPPSIGNLTNLQKLNLEHCSRLVKLPCSIGNAINLEELNLAGCSSLVELPTSMENATNLEILDLRNCSGLKRLPSIGNVSLQYLYLSNCSGLVKLPDSIGNATSLRELDLANCTSLVELPSSIGNATNLRKLDLSNCSSLVELPFSIGNATNLEYLYLSNCSSLLHLPSSIGYATSLQYLYLNNCSNLLDVPASIGNASNLKKLDLSWCTSLVELPDSVRNSTSLWQLNLDNCSSLLEVPSSIGNGVRIKKLDLSWCTSLVDELPVEIPSSSSNVIRYTTF